MADRVVRAKEAEQAMGGEEIRDEVIEEAAQKVIEDIAPITDARSNAEYRMQVSKVLVTRTMKQAIERAK